MKRESDKFITIVRSTKLLFQQLIEQGDSKSAMCKDQPNSTINQDLINICGTLPNSRMHILLKYPQSIYQDRLRPGTQTKPQPI